VTQSIELRFRMRLPFPEGWHDSTIRSWIGPGCERIAMMTYEEFCADNPEFTFILVNVHHTEEVLAETIVPPGCN